VDYGAFHLCAAPCRPILRRIDAEIVLDDFWM